jgi:hypothetical protein
VISGVLAVFLLNFVQLDHFTYFFSSSTNIVHVLLTISLLGGSIVSNT